MTPYEQFPETHSAPHASVEGLGDAMLTGYAIGAIADAAANPKFRYVYDPATGQQLFYADGTPMVERVTIAEQVIPKVYKALWIKRLVVLGIAIWFVVLFVGGAYIQDALGPDNWELSLRITSIISGLFWLSLVAAAVGGLIILVGRRR